MQRRRMWRCRRQNPGSWALILLRASRLPHDAACQRLQPLDTACTTVRSVENSNAQQPITRRSLAATQSGLSGSGIRY
jgi:hypothetical protein